MDQTEIISVAKDMLTGNLIVSSNLTTVSVTVTWDKLVNRKWQSDDTLPKWVKGAISKYLSQNNAERRADRIPYKVDASGKAIRPGDQWFTWGLLRTKTVNGTWTMQTVVQIEDDNGVARHATMAGYGDDEFSARTTLLDQMYEMRALIEDAIANVQQHTKGKRDG